MSFKDAPWDQRYGVMGDQAELAFEKLFPRGKARYGLRRPPIRVDRLPARIRYTPDYVTTDHLYEVMGVGSDQVLKVKVNKLITLHQWNNDMPTRVWVWDSHKERYMVAELDDFTNQVTELGAMDRFPEGKAYWGVDVNELDVAWQS